MCARVWVIVLQRTQAHQHVLCIVLSMNIITAVSRNFITHAHNHALGPPNPVLSTACYLKNSLLVSWLFWLERWQEQRGRPAVVVQQLDGVKWPADPGSPSRLGDRDRRITPGLGSILCGRMHRRVLVRRGEDLPHQCPGATGSNIRNHGILQAQQGEVCISVDRQYHSGGPHQSYGWNQVPMSSAVNQEPMAMVPRQGRPAECPAFTKEEESQSGLPLTSLERSVGLGLGCRAVWDDQQQAGAVGGRPFCNQVFSPPPQVLQLETRSNGRGYRRLGAGLEWIPGICESPLVPGRQDVAEGTGTGSNNCNCGSSLANAGMVSPIEQNAGGFSSAPPTQLRNPNSIPQLRWSDTRQCSTTGRLQGLRQRFQAGGFSEEAVQLILSSWRSKTEANYNSVWRKWQTWCVNRDVNPFDADLRHIVGFLADEFKEGKQYRSLNCYRSAISSTHLPIDGFPVGKHPMVCRLLKGAFNSRPPQPRYTETWDVAKVTRYIQSKGCNADLSLKDISMKLAMLLALTLASRSPDLVRLTVKGVRFIPNGVELIPEGLAKQARPGKEQSQRLIIIPRFPDERLCPVQCLQAYLKATSEFRRSVKFMKLFLSFKAPHKPVTSSSIARWVKVTLANCGIDTAVFSAHSTRGASATRATMSGLSVQQVLNRAGWSSEDTFCRHYYRPPAEVDSAVEYGQAVLRDSTNMQRTC